MLVDSMLDVVRQKLVTVADTAKLIEVARLLTSETDLVIVCDIHGALQGVITKTDVVRQISTCTGASCMCPAFRAMTSDVVLCRGSDTLQNASERMKARHLKNIPVVDGNNRPLGVLTARAVLRVLLSDAEYDAAQMVDYAARLHDARGPGGDSAEAGPVRRAHVRLPRPAR